MKNILKPSMPSILISACGLVLAATVSYTVCAQSNYRAGDAKESLNEQFQGNQLAGDTAKPQGAVVAVPGHANNQPNTSGRTRKLPQELQLSSNDGVSNSSKMRAEPANLSCSGAVDNARYGVETMLELAQKNFKAGYMEKPEYEAGTKGLRSILSRISTAECQTSTGLVRSFYQCMSGEHSHVAACGQKYNYQ
jgi:hypothetical protein